ncbi:MAG: DNA primase [Christensenellales bacterium]
MAGRFPTAWVDEVYARADIVEVVSAYLPLKRQGRNHLGLCPFHNEKSPSFSVNRDSNVYHCFGCKAGGNVVQFVMEMERLTYPEALLHLAKQLNIPPPPTESDPREEQIRSQKERLYQLNRDAALFYHQLLFEPAGKAVLEYLRGRGVDDAQIRRFGLGASSDEWTRLLDSMLAKGYTHEEMASAGLIHIKENSRYDVFRHRAMFPIIDLYGNTLGFGARAMGDAQPKYLNTQDTPVFNKRLGVYAINFLRKQRDLPRILLVEGYMDVLALSQFGITGAVATLGTALTSEQARLMKKFAPEVWIAYDGDEAGQNAALRALDIFDRELIPARVLRFPDGLDPDELLRQRGNEAFQAIKPETAMTFRLGRLQRSYDLHTQDGLTAYSIQACQMISTVPNPLERDNHLKELALATGFAKDLLAEQLETAGRRQGRKAMDQPAPQPRPKTRRKTPEQSEDLWAQRRLVSLLGSGLLPEGMITRDDFETDGVGSIARSLLAGTRPAQILSECEDEAQRSLASELFSGQNLPSRETALAEAEECLKVLRLKRLDLKIAALRQGMNDLDAASKRLKTQEIIALLNEKKRLESKQGQGKDVLQA